jgi:3'-5' exoribonuclease
MAQRQFIETLIREGQRFDEAFLLVEKELKTTANGKLFIRGTLQDRTGQCRFVAWEASEAFFRALPKDGFIRAKGRVELYQGRPQFVVEACLPTDERDVRLDEFLPVSQYDIAGMDRELRDILGSMAEGPVRDLAQAFLDDEQLWQAFTRAPAAKTNHHAWLGGLLEHTLGIMRLALQICPLYPFIQKDMLLLGILLHDIGKIQELSYARAFAYTDSGQLIGHLVQGAIMVEEKARALRAAGREIPDIIVQQAQHMILAHHGSYEYGSPKLPMTAEAILLHHIDNIDAKLVAFEQAVSSHPGEGDMWTGRQFMFDNLMLFRGAADERPARDEAAAGADESPRPRKGGLD